MNTNIELPPHEFSNVMEDIDKSFRYENWRKSPQWKIFVAGYNAAVRKANDKIMAQYDMGMNADKLFGKNSK